MKDSVEIQQIIAQLAHRIWLDVYETDKRSPTPIDKVHVGDILPECMRCAYYSVTVPFSLHSIETTMHFWHGKLLHSRPILPNSHQEFSLEWERILGHVDEYSTWMGGVGLEKKSTSNIPEKPKANHIRQGEYYRTMLEKLGHPCKHMFVVYFLKDMSPVLPTVFPIELRGVSFVGDEMIHKRDVVLVSRKNKILPPPLFGLQCSFCRYPSLCFGNVVIEK